MEPQRPSFPDIYMTLARALAGRSTCLRERVGTVITSVDFRKVLAVGYTGNATGLPNQCDHIEPAGTSDPSFVCGCLHSEENAIIHCDAPRSEPKIVFVTAIPCRMCAKRIIQLGEVVDLYYESTDPIETPQPSRRRGDRVLSALELLGSVGVRVHRLG